jgi:hypothetical protein
MHIAICFWGICRSTDKTIESIQKCIYDPLKNAGHTYEIFVHTFTLRKPFNNPRSNEINVDLDNSLHSLLEADKTNIEDQDTVDKSLNFDAYTTRGDPWSNGFITHKNHIRALYSLKQVTQLFATSTKTYDRVIYVRPDVRFLTPLNMTWFNCRENEILLPDFHCHPVNDRFAICHPQAAKIYGLRFSAALKHSKTHRLHAEEFLSHTLLLNRLLEKKIPMHFCRVRATGEEVPDCVAPK